MMMMTVKEKVGVQTGIGVGIVWIVGGDEK